MNLQPVIRKLFIIGCFLTSTVPLKEAMGFSCPTPFNLMYINGVGNSRDEAQTSLEYLITQISPKDFQAHNLKWNPKESHLGYNTSVSFWADLQEVYRQKEAEKTKDFWTWMAYINNSPEWFRKQHHDSYLKSLAPITQNDIYSMVLPIESNILSGYRVLIVAHSQGNLFGNAVVDSIRHSLFLHWNDMKKSVKLVSVATPASHVAGGESYVTLESDGVITPVQRSLVPNTLNRKPTPGRFDHEFIKHYLKGDRSGPAIKRLMLYEAGMLSKIDEESQPSPCIEWFESNVLGKSKSSYPFKSVKECNLVCVAASVGMDTFSCPSECAKLCQCYGQ